MNEKLTSDSMSMAAGERETGEVSKEWHGQNGDYHTSAQALA